MKISERIDEIAMKKRAAMGRSVVAMQKPLSVILQLLNWNITERGFFGEKASDAHG